MLILERFEGDWAVIEKDGKVMMNVLRENVIGASEGDVLVYRHGLYFVDQDATKERRNDVNKKFNNLWK
jgi:hypothetical protein